MGNIHALIIDDNPINLKVLSQLLSLAGATYTAVQEPRKVMEVLQNLENVSVIFLDLEMPQINGYEMLQMLKAQVGPSIPIVACTVHTSEMSTAHELGFHSFLGKPLQANRFPEQLRQILNGEPIWDIGGVDV